MRTKSNIPDSLKTINLTLVLRKQGMYTKQRMHNETVEVLKPIAKQILKNKKKVAAPEKQRHAQFTNEVVLAYWEKQIRIVEVLEKRFETKVEQYINKVIDGFLAHLDTEVSNKKSLIKAKDYFGDNEDDLIVQAQFDFTPLLIDQAVLAGQEAYKLIGSDDIYTPYKLRKTIARNVERFTKSMLDTDREKLINMIDVGLKEGQSVPEIRNAIQTGFEGEYSKMQAQRITRTEVLRASNQAAIDAYEQSGVVEGKQWLTAGAVDECAQYEGQIESLHANFYGDTDQFKDGDPPLHPNCKCVVLPVLINEKAYAPPINKELFERITELEGQVDKRTKDFKEAEQNRIDDLTYIKRLEDILGIKDE